MHRKQVMCIVMKHLLHPEERFHSAVRWVRVDMEGESRDFFDVFDIGDVSRQT